MLSKEEIEKDIKLFENVDLGDDIEFIKARKNLIRYIAKLEQEVQLSNFVHECDTNKIYQLEQENKRQNKMIDEMTEFIVSSAVVDDTVCSRIFCNEEGNCSYKKQKKCTKQYFEEKVEVK